LKNDKVFQLFVKTNHDLKPVKDSITLLDSDFVKNYIKIYRIKREVHTQTRPLKGPFAQEGCLGGIYVIRGNFQSNSGGLHMMMVTTIILWHICSKQELWNQEKQPSLGNHCVSTQQYQSYG
jgi:hypothetical protein